FKRKKDKCPLARKGVSYLSYEIKGGKMARMETHIVAIRKISSPQTKIEVGAFLGIMGYYRRFISNFAQLARPSEKLNKKASPTIVKLDEQMQPSFKRLKDGISKKPILQLIKLDRQYI
ncbi:uncharacterized protein TRIADDRAFT_9933, partial [Trichoplax adhaerens]